VTNAGLVIDIRLEGS